MTTLIDTEGAVLDGWRPTLAQALRVAVHAALPWADVSDRTLAGLLGCGRMAFNRHDPSSDVWARWLASAADQGVEFKVKSKVTPGGTSWKAVARVVGP